MAEATPLPPQQLRWQCAQEKFDFETSDELPELAEAIGQARAIEAIDFAVAMQRPGYNLYALGPDGIGKHTILQAHFKAAAAERPRAGDSVYVSNFGDLRKPKALTLPTGRGARLRNDMAQFVEDVRLGIRTAFESDEYRARRQVIEDEFQERRQSAIGEIEAEARERGVALMRSPIGFAFAPLRDGNVLTPEEFRTYPEDEKDRVQAIVEELQEKLKNVLQQAPAWMKQAQDKTRRLNDETAEFAVGHLIETLQKTYADLPAIVEFLGDVRRDVVRHVEAFVTMPEKPRPADGIGEFDDGPPLFRRYRVNLIVDNGPSDHAPLVYEDDPTYDRLLGRIEHRAEMGTLLTDLHMIRPGALHRANGGYLILDARKLLTKPLAWDGLKRALLSTQVRIEPMAQALGFLSTSTLEPEPFALDVKVAIVGERFIYYLLNQLDPEFSRLFKVAADFDERFDRSDDHNQLYARMVATVARREQLKPIDRAGMAGVLEFAARKIGDTEKLSTDIEGLLDLLREADHWASRNGRPIISADEIQHTIDTQTRRLDRLRDQLQEQVERGTKVIDTSGAVVGQINGLSVLQLGNFAFGQPSRITARVRLGRGEFVDIEREVKLGGALHSKGVLILRGFLTARYATDHPLSLSASLVFEQSYGGVEGDSASSAELYALLSAIAEAPIKQCFAVTGSVDQKGDVQAIGGVNEKIEGFFDLCAARGLTGAEGVLIPTANVKHLMLHRRVVVAVEAGKFKVIPVASIDQGLEVLTGTPAGQRGEDGHFPQGSLNQRIESRLVALAEARRRFGTPSLPEGEP